MDKGQHCGQQPESGGADARPAPAAAEGALPRDTALRAVLADECACWLLWWQAHASGCMQTAIHASMGPCRDDDQDLFDWQPEASRGSNLGAGMAKRVRKLAGSCSAPAGAARKRVRPEASAPTGLDLQQAPTFHICMPDSLRMLQAHEPVSAYQCKW